MTRLSACRSCGGPLAPWLDRVADPQTGELFHLTRCGRCGLGHTEPQPADMAPYYGAAYHGGRHGVTAAWCARRRIRWVTAACGGDGAGRRLLDVGCGDGTFLLEAGQRGWRTVGTELNPAAAREAGLDVRGSVDAADDGIPYDCITLWHSLEHMTDPRRLLARLAAMLGPGGVLVVAVPDAGGLQCGLFGRHWLHLDVPRHLYHFSRASLGRLLAADGCAVVRTMHHEFEYDLMGWLQSALNALLPVPNILFAALTGRRRPGEHGALTLISLLLAVLLAPAATLLVIGETLLGRGGTLVMVAQKTPRT
ncbi:class I SAM-dependent methyltransferase [Geobacter sulfurreducens]|jgi:SAM-dependent methyltransferase|uniref:class I SAM-dependent methyltransferase n=1 Tax=Geobacter sulfurreducens TaxID=35554 RepID=UPI0020B69CB2|nr:class I SAM-dependent methyltransferase [Geobacter sulfurreducens]UTG91863.1 class I SAM-dependent methyltransferase [Geobacter sulfurreducens]